ncbi:MAG TPA: CCA tRNA nucleotidyltransferase, partial [Acidimicrobiia bacterium]|nr:CCA tRNA nucleotidyltransferase [Acidimicrobiia bacterium]
MIPERLEFLRHPDLPPAQLAQLFDDAGEEIFLVGGSVRDAFLERDVEDLDFDFATPAHPERVTRILEPWADAVYGVGARFGTVAARKDGRTVEVTTYRSEVYRGDSRKPRVTYSDDIETDLGRRDFTINAIALSLPGLEAFDPFGGLADIAQETLRTPLAPDVSFGDDPLRMLRLFRFQATLGFVPDETAVDAVRRMGARLEIISAERIRDELNKLMVAPAPGDTLRLVVETGLAEHFLPELPGLAMEQDPHHHHKDVLAHTFAVVDKTSPDLTLRLAALFHDIGKPDTREIGADGVTFHHHEVVGARLTRHRMRQLRYPKDMVADVSQLVYLHLRPHTLKLGWSDSAVRRYVRDAGEYLGELNVLTRCDCTTRNEKKAARLSKRMDELEARIDELEAAEELASLRPELDGNAVMEHLGIGP